MKKLALHWKILIGLTLGVIYGLLASSQGWVDFTKDFVAPFGRIFVSALKLIAVPLVLFSLVNGVASLGDISKLGRIGGRTIVIYLCTTVIAVSIGLLSVNAWRPWNAFDSELKESLLSSYGDKAQSKSDNADKVKEASGPLSFLEKMVPSNIVQASANNGNMLQVITFAILFGIALLMVDKKKATPVKAFFEGVNEVVLKMVDIIMLMAPFGTFALIGALIIDIAGKDPALAVSLLSGLVVYMITVITGLAVMAFIVYPSILTLMTKYNPKKFFQAISPAQLLAFSTSSSAATLPVTMERCKDKVGVSEEVTSFVLPLGATINMDGTSLYLGIAAVFISYTMGIELTFLQQLSIVLTATLASIGTAAVPGAGIVMLIIILGQLGVPSEGLAIILGVDRILDMCRTVVNVTGDATVATIIAHKEGQLNVPLDDAQADFSRP